MSGSEGTARQHARGKMTVRERIDALADQGSCREFMGSAGRPPTMGIGWSISCRGPPWKGGTTDPAAGSKVIRLIQLCDTFHRPLVSFADEPEFMVGLEAELAGIERAGARLVQTVCESRVPWITFVVGRLYGVASAAYRREIESAPDPEARRAEIEARLNALASPFRTAADSLSGLRASLWLARRATRAH